MQRVERTIYNSLPHNQNEISELSKDIKNSFKELYIKDKKNQDVIN